MYKVLLAQGKNQVSHLRKPYLNEQLYVYGSFIVPLVFASLIFLTVALSYTESNDTTKFWENFRYLVSSLYPYIYRYVYRFAVFISKAVESNSSDFPVPFVNFIYNQNANIMYKYTSQRRI